MLFCHSVFRKKVFTIIIFLYVVSPSVEKFNRGGIDELYYKSQSYIVEEAPVKVLYRKGTLCQMRIEKREKNKRKHLGKSD